MTTEDLIVCIFCQVDERLPPLTKHPQAKPYPSERVTTFVLYALKGGPFRAFYRWLKRGYDGLFAGLPERSRSSRLLSAHRAWCDTLLAEPSFFTVVDSYPIELIFPIRAGRSPQQVGKKGRDKGRWSVGLKLCWRLNGQGQVVAWDVDTMNVHDQRFHPLLKPFEGRTIVLADSGFYPKHEQPDNLKLCAKGTWNERMVVETALSTVTVVCDLERLRHRAWDPLKAHLAFVAVMFNVLLSLFHTFHPTADSFQMSIAEFSL